MATRLEKELKRSVDVEGVTYTVIIDPNGLRIVGKGRRKSQLEVSWLDLVSGEAALAMALRASVTDGAKSG
jgi:hypothetical protein